MNDTSILGIDVAKEKVDVVLARGDKTQRRTFGNTPTGHGKLWQWLARHGATTCHACMEATGVYSQQLAVFLHERKVKVSVVNPVRIKGFRQGELGRTKTDEADAALIARFCQAMKPALWQPPAAHVKQLQDLVVRLQALICMRQQEVNRLKVSPASLQGFIRESIAFFEGQIKELKQVIKEHMEQHADLSKKRKLLESIPGIGEASIGLILSFVGEPAAFASAKQVAAFAGLSPRQCQSGSSVRGRGRLSKVGNRLLRQGLFLPAMVAQRYNPVLKAFAERLLKAGKSKMAVLGAVMRKLLHIVYGVLKSERTFEPALALQKP